jgi:hypothetical protein
MKSAGVSAMGWLLLGAVALLLLGAAAYDWRQRRRGTAVRTGSELERESMHSRLDLNAAPYEPARHAGQRDWATYRRRDRRRK